jgi:hypothetical protein
MVAVGSGAGKTEREEHKNDRRDGRENDEGNEDPAHVGGIHAPIRHSCKAPQEDVNGGFRRRSSGHPTETVAEENEQLQRLLETHQVCSGKLDALRAAVSGETSTLVQALEQVKASLEEELAALGHSFRQPFR